MFINVTSYSRVLALTHVQEDEGKGDNIFECEFIFSPLLFPDTFFLMTPPLSWVPRPRSSVILSLPHRRQSLSILPLKYVANPFPPVLLGIWPIVGGLDWFGASPLVPFPHSHSKYFPPHPALMMTHTCPRTLHGSYCRRKSPPRLDSEDLLPLDPDLPEWCSD